MYLKTGRAVVAGPATGPIVGVWTGQDWSSGHADEVEVRAALDPGSRAKLNDHAEHRGMTMTHAGTALVPLDRLVATVRLLALAAPVSITPPTRPGQPWTAKSDASKRPRRIDLTLDSATGQVLRRRNIAERPLIGRIIGYVVAVGEG